MLLSQLAFHSALNISAVYNGAETLSRSRLLDLRTVLGIPWHVDINF